MSAATTDQSDLRYAFPPLERRGVLLGLRPMPLAVLVGGGLIALGALRSLPGAAGAGAALVVVVCAVAAAFWPVAGQPPVLWAPTLVCWLVRRGDRPKLDAEPTAGVSLRAGDPVRFLAGRPARRSGVVRGGRAPRANPTAPIGLRIVASKAMPGEGEIGIVEDLVARSWAAVIPVRGPALTLLAPEDQVRRLATWGTVLAGLARDRSGIRRLQWVEQCHAGDPETLRRAADDASGPERACRSYRELVGVEAPQVLEHRAYLVVAVRARRSIPPRPMDPVHLGELLRRETRLIRAQLRAGDLGADDVLGPSGLATLLRAACDPTRPSPDVGPGDGVASGAWPAALEEHWGSVRVDGAWQATYWVAEWPRVPVGPDVLGPLLLGGGARTVSVTMAPVPAEQAVRQVQSARTAALADDALRSRAGFIGTAQRDREAEGVRRREVELADGHADYRYSGYVTVSGRTPEQLDAACAEVEQVARQSHLLLRRLYGRQAEARTWTLPLCRGLS